MTWVLCQCQCPCPFVECGLTPCRKTPCSLHLTNCWWNRWCLFLWNTRSTQSPCESYQSLKYLMVLSLLAPSLCKSYHTVDDVADGLFFVHAIPVVQHVTDAASTVHEPHVCFTALWYTAETVKPQTVLHITWTSCLFHWPPAYSWNCQTTNCVTLLMKIMSVSLTSGTQLKL